MLQSMAAVIVLPLTTAPVVAPPLARPSSTDHQGRRPDRGQSLRVRAATPAPPGPAPAPLGGVGSRCACRSMGRRDASPPAPAHPPPLLMVELADFRRRQSAVV